MVPRTFCCMIQLQIDVLVNFSPSRMLAKDELITLLQRCAEILQHVKSKKMKNALDQLEEMLTKFKQLDSKKSTFSHILYIDGLLSMMTVEL